MKDQHLEAAHQTASPLMSRGTSKSSSADDEIPLHLDFQGKIGTIVRSNSHLQLKPLHLPAAKHHHHHTGTGQALGMYKFLFALVAIAIVELYVANFMYTFHQTFREAEELPEEFFHHVGGHVHKHLRNFRNGGEDSTADTKENQPPPPPPQQQQQIFHHSNSDKSQLLELLSKAGVEPTPDLLQQLPPYDEIVKLYGNQPLIHGLDTCETYRRIIPPQNRSIGPAGMFNTGTNLLYSLLSTNCILQGNSADGSGGGIDNILWQVAWGKHTPASWRWRNFPKHWANMNQTNVLPIVIIKDPYTWMGSMCRASYSANWPHSDAHCPNLVRIPTDVAGGGRMTGIEIGDSIPVNVRYNQTHVTKHSNLAGLWNDWYGEYFAISQYPRIMVRYEDLLFRPESTLSQVCECAGGHLKDSFHYISHSAKGNDGPHSGSSDLSRALLRYSSAKHRIKSWTSFDIEAALHQLDPRLMKTFGYSLVD